MMGPPAIGGWLHHCGLNISTSGQVCQFKNECRVEIHLSGAAPGRTAGSRHIFPNIVLVGVAFPARVVAHQAA